MPPERSCCPGGSARQRSRVKALVFFLWLYVLWQVGLNAWYYIEYFFLSSPPDSLNPELRASLERFVRHSLASTVSGSISVLLQSAVIIWAIGHLRSSLIQDEFDA